MSESPKGEIKDQQQYGEVNLQIIMPQGVLNHYSNFALVDHETHTFSLSFFEIQKPPLPPASSPEERKKQLKEIGGIPAVCVARIILTPQIFTQLLQAMQANLQAYETTSKKPPTSTE